MESNHERIHALDALRATMLLLGVVLHIALTYSVEGWGSGWPLKDLEASTNIADHAFYFIHYFRMPIFFILAGFFSALLYMRGGILGLIKNRCLRIGIPFFIGIIILYPLVYFSFVFSVKANYLSIFNDNASSIVGASKYLYRSVSVADIFPPDNTTHLWFLYYLLYFYMAMIPLIIIARSCKNSWLQQVKFLFTYLLARPIFRIVLLSLMTAYVIFPAGGGILRLANRFSLDIDIFFAYFTFFGFGWMLFYSKDLLEQFKQYAWLQVLLACCIYLILSFWVWPNIFNPGLISGLNNYIVTSILASVLVWLMFFGLTGLFLRYLDFPSKYVRYMVDASYWIYLIHLPVTVCIPGLIVATGLSAGVKIIIVLFGTIAFGVITYDILVRSTFVGVILSGKRYHRGLPREKDITYPG
ncbi:MAG: acyltransferase family protein [Gammaproteobacteria bacterium]